MKRFKNKKDELAHIMIGAITSGMNQELFNYQLEEYRLLPESKEESYLNQVKNFDELVHINDQYFKDNPMLLDKL